MKHTTKELYQSNPQYFEHQSTIVAIKHHEDHKGIIVNETPFYAKGGGQPADKGYIIYNHKSVPVIDVIKNPDGEILHLISKTGDITINTVITLVVNKEYRILHSRIHTAGELIVPAVKHLIGNALTPTKAIHYPDNASVSFVGDTSEEQLHILQNDLENVLNTMIKENHLVEIITTNNPTAVKEKCGFIPDYIPPNSPTRIVTVYGEYGRPCRGTHTKTLQEIGSILVTKIKKKKGITKISYQIK